MTNRKALSPFGVSYKKIFDLAATANVVPPRLSVPSSGHKSKNKTDVWTSREPAEARGTKSVAHRSGRSSISSQESCLIGCILACPVLADEGESLFGCDGRESDHPWWGVVDWGLSMSDLIERVILPCLRCFLVGLWARLEACRRSRGRPP